MDLGPNVIMAADQQSIATAALEIGLNAIRHGLEVQQSFVHLLALDMSGIIAAPAITLAAPGEFIDEVLLLHDFVVYQFEDASLGAVDQHHAGRSEEHTSELQSRQYLVCR